MLWEEVCRRSSADEAEGLGACLRGGRAEPAGRRGMAIRASFRGCGVRFVRRSVRGKIWPSLTVGGRVKDMVRLGKWGGGGSSISSGGGGGQK